MPNIKIPIINLDSKNGSAIPITHTDPHDDEEVKLASSNTNSLLNELSLVEVLTEYFTRGS